MDGPGHDFVAAVPTKKGGKGGGSASSAPKLILTNNRDRHKSLTWQKALGLAVLGSRQAGAVR